MKTLKIVMLLVGILAFVSGTFNIVFAGLPNQWFGFIAGALLIWSFFNIDKVARKVNVQEQS